MTSAPAFKPEKWILYELEGGIAGYGQIAGATTSNNTWVYLVKGTTINGDFLQVPESSVKFILENSNWTEPSNFSGSNSAYASADGAV